MNQTDTLAPADEALLQMRSELKELLGRTQGAREVLAHLAGVERALKALGANAFENLPTLVLKRAASQLESVLPQPCGPGITELRGRLAKALDNIEKAQVAMTAAALATPAPAAAPGTAPAVAPAASPTAPRAAAYVNSAALQVSEATVTEFNRVVEASERKFT
jgi:hypothetical protein